MCEFTNVAFIIYAGAEGLWWRDWCPQSSGIPSCVLCLHPPDPALNPHTCVRCVCTCEWGVAASKYLNCTTHLSLVSLSFSLFPLSCVNMHVAHFLKLQFNYFNVLLNFFCKWNLVSLLSEWTEVPFGWLIRWSLILWVKFPKWHSCNPSCFL